MKLIILFEFGVPHYRKFIINWLKNKFIDIKIIHSGERFSDQEDSNIIKGLNFKLTKGISLCLFNFLQINNYDIIISTLNFRKPHTWIYSLIYRNKKWVFWGQGPGGTNSVFINNFKKYLINQSLGYVVYTPSGKIELENIGVKSEKISIAYNTLKIVNSEMTNGTDYLLYVGRIQKRKGLDKILYAIKKTSRKLVVVGDGGDFKNEFQNLVQSMGLMDQVIFKGAVYDDEILKSIFSNSVAYISPDHVGLGVVHAFAYGVPVVVCRSKEHAPEFSYCSEDNSYLYDKDSDLSNTIHEVFENDQKRIEKKNNAYKFYKENLNYKNVFDAFEYHFNKV